MLTYVVSSSWHSYIHHSYYSGSSGGSGSSSNAFIFSLRNKEGLGPFKSMVKSQSSAIYRGSNYGPTFGGGWDIFIANNANSNTKSYTNFGHSNSYYYSVPSGVQDRQTILAGTYNFTPDEVEVFYLGWVAGSENKNKRSTVLHSFKVFLTKKNTHLSKI